MITIKCENDSDFVNINTVITIDERATVDRVFYGIIKAMLVEGYSIKSIDKHIQNIASSINDNYTSDEFLGDLAY